MRLTVSHLVLWGSAYYRSQAAAMREPIRTHGQGRLFTPIVPCASRTSDGAIVSPYRTTLGNWRHRIPATFHYHRAERSPYFTKIYEQIYVLHVILEVHYLNECIQCYVIIYIYKNGCLYNFLFICLTLLCY